jgi:hypothetical protein
MWLGPMLDVEPDKATPGVVCEACHGRSTRRGTVHRACRPRLGGDLQSGAAFSGRLGRFLRFLPSHLGGRSDGNAGKFVTHDTVMVPTRTPAQRQRLLAQSCVLSALKVHRRAGERRRDEAFAVDSRTTNSGCTTTCWQ